MHPMEIAWLCIVCAVVGGLFSWWLVSLIYDLKCDHKFEEVLKTVDGGRSVVVHMCKKCGKRKITKV